MVDRAVLAPSITPSGEEGPSKQGNPSGSSTSRTSVLQPSTAENVDVYRNCNGVIVIFDVTRPRSIDYVTGHIGAIPQDLPVLILGNFADKYFEGQVDLDFQQRRFLHSRGITASYAPLHFMLGSLLHRECPHNPKIGLLSAILKFFELPFLQMQRKVLDARLRISEEQIEKAMREWDELLDDQHSCANGSTRPYGGGGVLAQPEAARTTNDLSFSIQSDDPNINVLLSTDTLTRATTQAWNSPDLY